MLTVTKSQNLTPITEEYQWPTSLEGEEWPSLTDQPLCILPLVGLRPLT